MSTKCIRLRFPNLKSGKNETFSAPVRNVDVSGLVFVPTLELSNNEKDLQEFVEAVRNKKTHAKFATGKTLKLVMLGQQLASARRVEVSCIC